MPALQAINHSVCFDLFDSQRQGSSTSKHSLNKYSAVLCFYTALALSLQFIRAQLLMIGRGRKPNKNNYTTRSGVLTLI